MKRLNEDIDSTGEKLGCSATNVEPDCTALMDTRIKTSDAQPQMSVNNKPRESHRAIWLDLSKTKFDMQTKVAANTAIGTKLIEYFPMTKLEYNKYRGWDMPENEGPNREGYVVEYLDSKDSNHPNHEHYISWSPKDVFDRAYRPTTGMNFGLAVEAMKKGMKVSRKGWNGKGMFLWLKPAATIKSDWCKDPMLKDLCDKNGGEIEALGTISMYTTDSSGRKAILTGWLASQSDMLSDDWVIVG